MIGIANVGPGPDDVGIECNELDVDIEYIDARVVAVARRTYRKADDGVRTRDPQLGKRAGSFVVISRCWKMPGNR